MDSVKVFLSATGLIWCAFFALIMIGIIYLIKRKNNTISYEGTTKIFLLLYILTMVLIINEFILHHAFTVSQQYPTYTLITSKMYVLFGLFWNFFVLIYYIFLYRKNKQMESTEKFKN